MLTGEIRSKVDQVWNAFWADEIANPLEIVSSIIYLLFMPHFANTRHSRGLDKLSKEIRKDSYPKSQLAGRLSLK